MALLNRSQSAAAVHPKDRTRAKDASSAALSHPRQLTSETKRPTQIERPKTADDRLSRSFSRPRTANSAMERTVEVEMPIEVIQFKALGETYNFPTPSPRLPQKDVTFQLPPTPASMASLGDSPAIGVALGSPTQAAPKWGRAFTTGDINDGRQQHRPTAHPAPSPLGQPLTNDAARPQRPELKKKKSSWKSIASLFGRKSSKPVPDEPFYKVKVPQEPNAEQSRSLDVSSPPPPASRSRLHARRASMTRGMARVESRKQADLAQFHGGNSNASRKIRSPSMIQKDGFSPLFRALGTQRESQEIFNAEAHDETRRDSPMSMNDQNSKLRTPRLNLDLPSPAFERYSIMFEKVLDEPKQSLLERRQSRSKKKKSLLILDPVNSTAQAILSPDGPSNSAPHRSATSPGLRKRLSIKIGKKDRKAAPIVPTVEEPATALHRPRPIGRSKTAPPGSQSPVAQNFLKTSKQPALASLTPTSQTFSVSENSLPPTPTTTNTAMSDIDSVAIIQTGVKSLHRKPSQTEPSWDMLTSKAMSPEPKDSRRERDAYSRVKSPEDLEKQIVQVSVARQVSVSKARKTVQAAISTKQPLRPRVVELGRDRERKSTVVLIEGGDD
jgi:hypothetical protein